VRVTKILWNMSQLFSLCQLLGVSGLANLEKDITAPFKTQVGIEQRETQHAQRNNCSTATVIPPNGC